MLGHVASGQQCGWREWQYAPLCGDNIHPCRGHVAGVWCGWREWHVVVWHNVPPVSPHHTVTALWATWQHHHTFGFSLADQSWQKKSKSSSRIRIIYDKEGQIRLWPVCLPSVQVTAVLVRCHRAAIIDGPDTSPGQSCLTAAPCNMDMWTAGHYLNWILLLHLG